MPGPAPGSTQRRSRAVVRRLASRPRRRRRSRRPRPDSLGGTAADDGRSMPPQAPAPTRPPKPIVSPTRLRRRREPAPLEQIPAWQEMVPVMDPGAAARLDPGLEALLDGLNPVQLRAVTHGQGPLLVVAGAGTGKTQVITRRIAWLIATRRAR